MTENALPKRKPTRLQNFDYSNEGIYFITICAQHRKHRFSYIVGEGFSLPSLSAEGKIIADHIDSITQKYPNAYVDRYVIMPNHIHLLLVLKEQGGRGNPSPTASAIIGWLKYQCTKSINLYNGKNREKIFQRSFHDHVVRDRHDYRKIAAYIANNPQTWREDCFFSE